MDCARDELPLVTAWPPKSMPPLPMITNGEGADELSGEEALSCEIVGETGFWGFAFAAAIGT
jgi:hypothetical protein